MPETDHVSDADTHAAIAKRLGMKYGELLAELDFDHENANAIIRDRAAEALRKRGYSLMDYGRRLVYDDTGGWFQFALWTFEGQELDNPQLVGVGDYPSALLAALDLVGIGGSDA